MASYTQDGRPIAVNTPLGKDVLLLEEFTGAEKLSGLFRFSLSCLVEDKKTVDFNKILGQGITITIALPENKKRFFHGIVNAIGLTGKVVGGPQSQTFIRYRVEMVPQFWLLTKKSQSRIFQNLSVPDILKKVLTGLTVSWKIQGTFEPRNYCVQYRETDFAFASRLMEEEGIYYFFTFADGKHEMVVSNDPGSHADVPGPTSIIYEELMGGAFKEDRIHQWALHQEVHSGKITLWDYNFEMPEKNLEVSATTAVAVAANDKLEIYDYPGGAGKRFDGVDAGGGDQAAKLAKIQPDDERVSKLRLQHEEAPHKIFQGEGTCRQFSAGHKFSMTRHYNAAFNAAYVLTEVNHQASIAGAYTTSGVVGLLYKNTFAGIPAAVPFRPRLSTPKPIIHGTQTALVVGRSGDEIFTDKYGRVKVQFHWDREGKKDGKDSCWVRVGTPWAGKQWGMIHIPRVGHEVIVTFEDGDPDKPLIVGSVYNATNMPPWKLPDKMTYSGLVSRSTQKGGEEDYHEFRFEDKKGEEYIYLRSQKDNIITVENDEIKWIGHDNWIEVDNDEETTIKNNRTETIKEGNEKLTIEKGKRETKIKLDDILNITDGDNKIKIDKGAFNLEAATEITLKVGESSITMKKDGTIEIKGKELTISGTSKVTSGVTNQSVTCDTSKTEMAGAQVSVSAQAKLALSGAQIAVG